MGAGWHQSALGTSALDKQLALQIDSSFLQLIESLHFEQLPDLLLRQVSTFLDNFTLFVIETIVESGAGRFVMVAKWLLRPLKSTLICSLVLNSARSLHQRIFIGR